MRAWDGNKAIFIKEEKVLDEIEEVFAAMKLEPEMLAEVISYIKMSSEAEQDFHKRKIAELHSEHTKIMTRMLPGTEFNSVNKLSNKRIMIANLPSVNYSPKIYTDA